MAEINLMNEAKMIVGALLGAVPKDTGALASSIGFNVLDNNTIEILVGNEIVDYAVHTNIEWQPPINLEYFPSGRKRTETDKSRLKSFKFGGKNPNEGWFDISLEQCLLTSAEKYKGVYLREL